MGTSIAKIERHYGTLLSGAAAGIASRLAAFKAAQDDQAERTRRPRAGSPSTGMARRRRALCAARAQRPERRAQRSGSGQLDTFVPLSGQARGKCRCHTPTETWVYQARSGTPRAGLEPAIGGLEVADLQGFRARYGESTGSKVPPVDHSCAESETRLGTLTAGSRPCAAYLGWCSRSSRSMIIARSCC
jgi:hypothetical protein